MTVQEQTAVDVILSSAIFDADYYTGQTKQSFSSVKDAIAHYLDKGCAKGLNPHPLFDTRFYLNNNQDVAKAGVNPLIHYISQGGLENRKPSEYFDGPFYLQNNADVSAQKVNPLSHFIAIGAAQARKPNAVFDTAFYLKQYPEVAESGENPLVHYVLKGAREGKRPNSRPDYPRDLYLQMRQLEPLLPPFAALQTLRESRESFLSKAGYVYDKIKPEITKKFSHLFVTTHDSPSLAWAASIIETLIQSGSGNHALILICGRHHYGDQIEENRLQNSATVITLQNYGKKLEPEEELQIICRLAIQAKPRVIHAIGSRVCLDLFRRMHKPLSLHSKLFATALAFSTDEDGVPSGPNLFLSPCADALTAIFAVDEDTLAKLKQVIGFDNEMLERLFVVASLASGVAQLKQFGYFND